MGTASPGPRRAVFQEPWGPFSSGNPVAAFPERLVCARLRGAGAGAAPLPPCASSKLCLEERAPARGRQLSSEGSGLQGRVCSGRPPRRTEKPPAQVCQEQLLAGEGVRAPASWPLRLRRGSCWQRVWVPLPACTSPQLRTKLARPRLIPEAPSPGPRPSQGSAGPVSPASSAPRAGPARGLGQPPEAREPHFPGARLSCLPLLKGPLAGPFAPWNIPAHWRGPWKLI